MGKKKNSKKVHRKQRQLQHLCISSRNQPIGRVYITLLYVSLDHINEMQGIYNSLLFLKEKVHTKHKNMAEHKTQQYVWFNQTRPTSTKTA